MKTITLFYLEHCPYCINARRALDELTAENPAYASVRIHWVEESRESELADKYDYYRVPTVFFGEEKLYEADPSERFGDIKAHLKAALDKVLAD